LPSPPQAGGTILARHVSAGYAPIKTQRVPRGRHTPNRPSSDAKINVYVPRRNRLFSPDFSRGRTRFIRLLCPAQSLQVPKFGGRHTPSPARECRGRADQNPTSPAGTAHPNHPSSDAKIKVYVPRRSRLFSPDFSRGRARYTQFLCPAQSPQVPKSAPCFCAFLSTRDTRSSIPRPSFRPTIPPSCSPTPA